MDLRIQRLSSCDLCQNTGSVENVQLYYVSSICRSSDSRGQLLPVILIALFVLLRPTHLLVYHFNLKTPLFPYYAITSNQVSRISVTIIN